MTASEPTSSGGSDASAVLAQVVKEDRGRMLAALIRRAGDFALAEDSLQDALASALNHWPRSGVPEAPRAWLLRTAQRKAIDRLRRSATAERHADSVAHLQTLDQASAGEDGQDDAIPDERLRLIFTCCHPALAPKTRVALTLRTLGGLTTAEIARAFLDQESALAQRLVRAQRKIKDAGIPYEVPELAAWPERLDSVLKVLYLIFNEGYAASSGTAAERTDLCLEAERLARLLSELRPEEPETEGLLALLLCTRARLPGRGRGAFIPLSEQDRRLWDSQLIAEGTALAAKALGRGQPGPFQVQAAISALHVEAESHEDTDWPQIVLLYETLEQMTGNPVATMNRAVALANVQGPAAGLAALAPVREALAGYRGLHAAEADLLRREGNQQAAAAAYQAAIAAGGNAVDTAFLEARLESLDNR